jgi:hypothetical protein
VRGPSFSFRLVAPLLFLLFLLFAPAQDAHADWIFSPFVGGTFGSATALPDLDQGVDSTQVVFGGSVGWLGTGLLGLEMDVGYSPRFFEQETDRLIASRNVTTVSVDVIVAAPASVTRESLRPYLVGGGSWIHAAIEEAQPLFPEIFGQARNSAGFNVGLGAIGLVTNRTGLRFEVRHFRSLERDENPFTAERQSLLRFWRATVGVLIRR